ncbi:Leo1-like protein-domain-containing protein [Massariosphaeria phaeospora]|uniref:Leo1-like protein-domain-containing protein n=1 Tax=Massariosphaeria phaeospora TaxID=100035 RepID=A0A7C8HZY4_9PLEO|nr:Leo1-like protein-domain-containing protein [Massariosphaeria phaeospora]
MASPEVATPPDLEDNLEDNLQENLTDEDDVFGDAGLAGSDAEGAPRDTVEESGLDGAEDDDLFGDGGEDGADEDQPLEQPRKLDDEDLDSGDDEGRADRVEAAEDDSVEQEQLTYNYQEAEIARHAVPEPSDGELYLLKVPKFLAFEPAAFNPKNFTAPKTDHHSREKPSEQFSAYDTAMSTIRWRRSPSDPSQLQSNARVLRWSDGSLTLQFASHPVNQYDINSKPLAPPQLNPKKPTPTQITKQAKSAYKESYQYLVAPCERAGLMRMTNKLTTQLTVAATATTNDHAVEKLQSDLAELATRGRGTDQAISFIKVEEDPELLRAREEAQFKEKQRQARAREKHEMRERERTTRTMGRSTGRAGGYGLSIDDLEGAEGGRRSGVRKPRAKTGTRRGWSSDEDYGIRGKTSREDEYDEEDDFIAASDEEPEIVDDDDEDLDEGIGSPPRRGAQSPKRGRGRKDVDGDGDDDDEVVVSRTKRRRVVEDDDEDE